MQRLSDSSTAVESLTPRQRALLVERLKKRSAGCAGADIAPRIKRCDGPEGRPLSFAQERLWFLDQLDPGNTAYNLATAVRIKGALNVPVLEKSIGEIKRRHEVLRARFTVGENGPLQFVQPVSEGSLVVDDLAAYGAEERERRVKDTAAEEARKPFNLKTGPVMRLKLVRLGADEHVLLFTMHHIVTDAWSMTIIVREFVALYDAFSRNEPSPLHDLPIQYSDYSVWQRGWLSGAKLTEQMNYWKQRLNEAPAALELPAARPRRQWRTYRGGEEQLTIARDRVDLLKAFGQQEAASLFITLLAAFQALLHRVSGQDDICVGAPISNRNTPELENLIGFFVNTLVLRTDCGGNPDFCELLRRTRDSALGAYDHQDLPFEKLVQQLHIGRDLTRSPLFQVFFNFWNFVEERISIPGLVIEPFSPAEVVPKFDLTVYLQERADGLLVRFVYNADLFPVVAMRELISQYDEILAQISRDPHRPIGECSLITSGSRQVLPDPAELLVAKWRGSVLESFSEQSHRHPDRPMVIDAHATWTGSDLEIVSDWLAGSLLVRGLQAGDVVAVYGARNGALVCALLGILKARGVFLILDPSYPAQRLLTYLSISRARGWIQVQGAGEPTPELSAYVNQWLAYTIHLPGTPAACLGSALNKSVLPMSAPAIGPDDPAYVAFTSGSTGTPKAILGSHRPLAHFIEWHVKTFGFSTSDRFSFLSGLGHDPALRDVFTPLAAGATLYSPAPEDFETPGGVVRWTKANGLTVMHLTPSLGRFLTGSAPANAEEATLPSLRYAFFGGEQLRQSDVSAFRKLAPAVTCVNFYGATETPQAMGFHVIRPLTQNETTEDALPVGRGVDGVQLLVLNRYGRLAGVGEVGEIVVRTPYLSSGYLDDDELTRSRFIPSPFVGGSTDDQMYRTGDMGTFEPDGTVRVIRRADTQVKIRGFRVELAEVEAALRAHKLIRDTAVVAKEDRSGENRLVAFVVGEQMASGQLREFLRVHLPEYMIPSAFVPLERLPLTANGKVNRNQLMTECPTERDPERHSVEFRTPVEELVAGLWKDVLRLEHVGVNDDFFELGGHSLLATQLMSRVRDAFGIEFPLRVLFQAPTIARMAEMVNEARTTSRSSLAPPIARQRRDHETPLSFAQERLWVMDQLERGTAVYNVPRAVRFEGVLDIRVLRQTAREIIRRHETLRTIFALRDGGPVQVVQPVADNPLLTVDLSQVGDKDRDAHLKTLMLQEAQRPFDLARGPLLRIILVRLKADDHILLWMMHHIVTDGWSMEIFIREFVQLYQAFSRGDGNPLPELPIQYGDYVLWQRRWLDGDVLREQINYWKQQVGTNLRGALQLPTDGLRREGKRSRAAIRSFVLSKELSDQLIRFSRQEGITLFMLLLAAFKALLARYAEVQDVVVGTFVANRNRTEVEGLIGFFVNYLILRTDVSGDPSFRELLRRVREVTLEAHAHQDLPFQKLIDELPPQHDIHHQMLHQVMFMFQNTPTSEPQLPGLRISPIELEWKLASVDLYLAMSQTEDGLKGHLEYPVEVFQVGTIESLLRTYTSILERVAAKPETRVGELELDDGLTARRRALSVESMHAISIAATFTAEPIRETMGFWKEFLGFSAQVKFAPYNQVFQQLLDPTSLQRRNERGVNVVLIRIQDLQRYKTMAPEETRQQVLAFAANLKTAAQDSSSPYILGICPGSSRAEEGAFLQEMERLLELETAGTAGLHVVTASDWCADYPISDFCDPHADELGHVPYHADFFTVIGTVLIRKIHALWNQPYKVIVLDADQTLWKGVAAEDGVSGVEVDAPRKELQEFIVAQQKAGKLICICSKSNEKDVAEVFEWKPQMVLRREHIVTWKINWRAKSENIRELAEELNLSLDSFIFIDDNPVECAEVQAHCPEVLVAQWSETHGVSSGLRRNWAFDCLASTGEDSRRTLLYRQNIERTRSEKAAGDFKEFLAGLELRVDLAKAAPSELARIAQLTQRTNQFNTSRIRRTESELAGLLTSSAVECLAVRVEDRFGDYGLVGAILFQQTTTAVRADTFLLSCRVLGKGVEHQMLSRFAKIACERGIASIEIEYVVTDRNAPALEFLSKAGGLDRRELNAPGTFQMRAADLVALEYVPSQETNAVGKVEATDRIAGAATKTPVSSLQRIVVDLSTIDKIQAAVKLRTRIGWRREWKDYVAPQTPTEESIAQIWSQLLGVDQVGIHENFFDLGGHSILATQLISRLRDAFNVELPLPIIFSTRFTVCELSKAIMQLQMENMEDHQLAEILEGLESLSNEEAKVLAMENRAGDPLKVFP